jgi:hypothetical protein
MSHPNEKPAHTFLLKIKPEQAHEINEFRWTHRQPSQSEAVRKLIDMGLAIARQVKQGKAA